MSAMEDGSPIGTFEVGVAIVVPAEEPNRSGNRDDQQGGTLPGYDEAFGRKPPEERAVRRLRSVVVEKGDEAVRVATEAIARQIGLAAQRIAAAIEAQAVAAPGSGELGLESVEVTFGITLSAGVQAMFTTQSESSAQVSITLARRPAVDS